MKILSVALIVSLVLHSGAVFVSAIANFIGTVSFHGEIWIFLGNKINIPNGSEYKIQR